MRRAIHLRRGRHSWVGFGDHFDKWLAEIVKECGYALEGDGITLHDKGMLPARKDCSSAYA
jgi:hypothetical protein